MSQGSKVKKQYTASEFLRKFKDEDILVEAAIRRGQSYSQLIKPNSPSTSRIDLGMWKSAYFSARNVESPNLNPMYEVYDNVMIDNTLSSMYDSIILKVQQSKFHLLDKSGKPDDESRKLFERMWFQQFIKLAMKSRFQGYVLIELFDFKEDGELANVTEINKYNVKPQKGIVTKEPGDETGWDYLNGQQALYYIPVGDVDDLGMLYKVAPHILAKKYAIGNWGEFNEKFGQPFRTVHSNSIDANRQRQLATIMENMGSAGWAVLNENEKVELMDISGTDPTKCFEGLINLLNSEVAMLINGQSSTSNSQNNKGTYGSMKILQEISDDRHEFHLVFLKYLINDVLIPRLVQYSPVYRKLTNLVFEWDRSEDLSVDKKVDYIVKLSDKYKIPPEYVTSVTGIPVEAIADPVQVPNPPVGAKKKSLNIRAVVRNLYAPRCCNKEALNSIVASSVPSFEEDSLRIAKELWEGKKKGPIDIKLLKKTAEYLREGITSGFGKITEMDDRQLLKHLERNVYVFSGFKTHQQLKEATDLLKDENGKLKTFDAFKKDILNLDATYNERFLKAEYDHAQVGSQMASKWTDIQRNKSTLPMLQFDATLDSRTTSVCRALDGMIAPVDDEVWNNYFPPLHWGERSTIRQLSSGKATDKSTVEFPDIKPMFRNNIGKSGVAFPESHPYYNTTDKEKKLIMKQVDKIYPDPNDYKTVFKHKSGGSVSVHSTHRTDEISYNTKYSKVLAKQGHEVKLLDYVEQRKNPDISIDGKIADFKEIKTPTKGAVVNHLRSAGRQQVEIAVLVINSNITKHILKEGIYSALFDKNRLKSIKSLWLMYGNKTVKIERKEVKDGSFIDKLL